METNSSFQHAANAEREKFDLGHQEFPTESASSIPDTYGDNRLVLLPRDPFWFFTYWEFTADRREYIGPMARAAVAAGADGLILEVHPKPEEALSDGPQSLLPEQFAKLMAELRAVALAVGRTV